jgi:uncharacterized protein
LTTREIPIGGGYSITVTEFSAGSGRTLAVLGGVHGDELEGIVASGIVTRYLAGAVVTGGVRIVSVANPPAQQANSRTSPLDGRNLARCFPGTAAGTVTERIARAITDEVIAGADLLVDLHSAGSHYEMPVFVGYDSSAPTGPQSGAAAMVFGAPLVWRHAGVALGRSLSAAAGLAVPSIYVEGSGGASLRAADVDVYVSGVRRLLSWLCIIDEPLGELPEPTVLEGGDGDVDASVACNIDGFCMTQVRLGETVAAGQVLGEIIDINGVRLEEIVAPRAGRVMMLRRTANIRSGDGVAMLGPSASITA